MRLDAGLRTVKDRVRRPETWGAILLFAWLWDLMRPGMRGPGQAGSSLDGFLVAFLLGALLLVIAPIPWQWTADERASAGFARGLLQSLVWNVALVVGVSCLLPFPAWEPMMGRGMMRGLPMAGPVFFQPGRARVLVLGLATVAFGVILGRILAERDGERARADEAERCAREAQTRALQAQMNPHVLFNVISGLAELARENPAATEDALVKLAEVMRRLLEHADRIAAPLAQERALVERLLALEQFRLGERLKVTWVWDPSLEALQVPPLLLQPLVENAIKHGIAGLTEGGVVRIFARREGKVLELRVENPVDEDTPVVHGLGIGLRQVRSRLQMRFGDRMRFESGVADGVHRVQMIFPAEEPADVRP